MDKRNHRWNGAGGFLSALARDVRANTLVIMAIALIPLAGMVGGGIDISRMYIVKTRLQHACDAGALAGRKTMGGGTWSQTVDGISNYPKVQAETYFDANYDNAAYGVNPATVSKQFTESAGKVSGTAAATVPMTLMRIFRVPDQTLTVTCDAEMRLPNTDVMFVLDNTGSMDCDSAGHNCGSAGSNSKMAGLRVAVKCFYQIVARLDITDVDCDGDEPSGGTGDQVQIRFGFVPYSVNVNVGKLLPPGYFPDSWDYQTRWPVTHETTSNMWVQQGDPTQTVEYNVTVSGINSNNDCDNRGLRNAGTSSDNTNGTTKTTTAITYSSPSWSGKNKICSATKTTTVTTYQWQTVTQKVFDNWRYFKLPIPIGGLKTDNGTKWGSSYQLTLPIGDKGADRTITWNGCIEERKTITGTSFDPIPSEARDLDIDSVPTSDVDSMWKPALGDIEYMRKTSRNGDFTRNDVSYDGDFSQPDNYCPTESRRMQAWPSPQTFDDYVDSLRPVGNTYHDIGLLWGARLISPTGIFRSENEYTSKGGEIERHIIFMTDGDTQTSTSNYAAYGLPWYDRRNVSDSDVGNSPGGDMDAQVNARFVALCTAIKNKNITLWVIAFGNGTNTTTQNRLKACATSGRFFTAADSSALQKTFKSIADQISQLRLTK